MSDEKEFKPNTETRKTMPLYRGEGGNRELIGECEAETLPDGTIEITNFIFDKNVAETIVGSQNTKASLPPLPWFDIREDRDG